MPGASDQRRVLVGAAVVLAGFVVLGGVLLGLSLVPRGHAHPAATPTPTRSASGLPSQALDDPSVSASPTPSTAPTPTPAQMQDFLVQYLDTATTNQAASWAVLSPRFRAASGGFAAYQDFWGGIAAARASDIVASPADGVISYRVEYTRRDGGRSSDATRLRLVYDGTTFRIDGEG